MRELSKAEKRVNFAAIERIYTKDAAATVDDLSSVLREVLKNVIAQLENTELSAELMQGIVVDTGTRVRRHIAAPPRHHMAQEP